MVGAKQAHTFQFPSFVEAVSKVILPLCKGELEGVDIVFSRRISDEPILYLFLPVEMEFGGAYKNSQCLLQKKFCVS